MEMNEGVILLLSCYHLHGGPVLCGPTISVIVVVVVVIVSVLVVAVIVIVVDVVIIVQ